MIRAAEEMGSRGNERVVEVENGVYRIDLLLDGCPGVVAAYLLTGDGPPALVETGPASTLETLLSGIREAGVDPLDIGEVLITHIHLDHAGGAGDLLARLPSARLHVHPSGAAHLLDPSRLLASARRIYGDALESLWGGMEPVPHDRLEVLADQAVVTAAGRAIRVLHTPGHAGHHCAFHLPERSLVFTGDVAGIRLGGIPHVVPPTPPPEIDLSLWRSSVLRLRELNAEALALTHFGIACDVDWHLDELLSRLHFWAGWIQGRAVGGISRDQLAAELAEREAAAIARHGEADLVSLYERAIPYGMSVDGLLRALGAAVR
jgi:glyoxylase-like metal-dependent hydrolase (beta-lactamase superfamily II)